MISRRALLAAAATAAAPRLVLGATAPANLGDAAAANGLPYGASIGQEAFDDSGYADLYRRQAQILTTDVAMKFDWLRPAPDRFDFSHADAVVRFAADNGKPLRGHTLIWNDRAPDWLKRLPGREVERIFDAHIDRVVERYAGKLYAWDVVNEPFWRLARRPVVCGDGAVLCRARVSPGRGDRQDGAAGAQ
jgi:endo-1,4-beta-xylanase